MRVFVTGASGYAGFYATLRLAATGHTVTGIVRHPDQLRLNILRMQEVMLLTGDVCEPATYRSELARSDVIIHTMLDKKRPFETDRALFGALQALPPRTPRRRLSTRLDTRSSARSRWRSWTSTPSRTRTTRSPSGGG
jgi:putative NADH-flavin reductase